MGYFALPFGIFFLDQKLKSRIEDKGEGELPKKIFGGRVLLRRFHNRGAAFGLLKERPGMVQILSVILWGGLTGGWMRMQRKNKSPLLNLGMTCLVGGAASNVYDRLKRKYVVDYFSFSGSRKKFGSVVFNLGDLFIFSGSFLVILWNLCRKS